MAKEWKLLERTLKLKSKWVTVYADRLLDNQGRELDYWHYDRPDSVIVIVIQHDSFVLPAPEYRVGIDEVTLDFAGSRLSPDKTPQEMALQVLSKELGITKEAIEELKPIHKTPLAVDSSFSSQKLHGFICRVNRSARMPSDVRKFALSEIEKLHQSLLCGQCRLMLDEYLLNSEINR